MGAMAEPLRVVVTGASGFIGRHLLESLKETCRVYGIARRSQVRSGAPIHPNITWFQVDIADRESLSAAFRAIRQAGGADMVVHLAAHYDFTGDKDPEYWRTNVDGLRNVLEESVELSPRLFVFASSVAACAFPPKGGSLNESSPADGDHIYAVTKRIGEEMLAEYEDRLHTVIVRFAALFSDWCEYPPLYFFLETWLSKAWNSRILAGRGASAIPYLHVRDAVAFLRRVLVRGEELDRREVVIASPDGALGHLQLFDLALVSHQGVRRRPVMMPRTLCRIGVWVRDLAGRLLGNRPFERPWMVRYIDASLTIDASRTRRRLGWEPRDRLDLTRRMPFLVENMKTEPVEWHRRNRAAMKQVQMRTHLRIHRLLEKNHDRIRSLFIAALTGPEGARRFPSYQSVKPEILAWRFTVVLRHLMNAVRTGDKGVFTAYCRDLAAKRFEEGFEAHEVCGAITELDRVCVACILEDPESEGLEGKLRDHLSMTIQFGCDQIHEIFEDLGGDREPI